MTAEIQGVATGGSLRCGPMRRYRGAALVAIAPFAIFYSTEARAYGTLAFLVAFSTYALLRALESSERRWWVAYGVASCAALYAHYTAIFPLAAQVAWAAFVHRDRL